jgi:hypothetical protein
VTDADRDYAAFAPLDLELATADAALGQLRKRTLASMHSSPAFDSAMLSCWPHPQRGGIAHDASDVEGYERRSETNGGSVRPNIHRSSRVRAIAKLGDSRDAGQRPAQRPWRSKRANCDHHAHLEQAPPSRSTTERNPRSAEGDVTVPWANPKPPQSSHRLPEERNG